MIVLACIIIVFLIFYIVEYNTFKVLKNKVKQSKSSIDVYLNQRFDLIPNLVEVVKGYAKHEETVFENIARVRAEYLKNTSINNANKVNGEFNNLMAIAENMPDLKASENFLKLQKELERMENQLQAARRLYNGDVTVYNTKLETFPGNIIASTMGLKEEELLTIEEYKRENPLKK